MEDRFLSRVEKFRKKRSYRRRYILAVMLLFFILITGIWAVDSSTNYLMSGQYGIELINVESNPTYIKITFMNKKLYINTRYINRDLERLKSRLATLISHIDD
jgi:hypothetical protein